MAISRLSFWVVIVGTVLSGLLSLLIVGAAVYLSVLYGSAPEFLVNWGGLIVGFFFGSFFDFVRNLAGENANGVRRSARPIEDDR